VRRTGLAPGTVIADEIHLIADDHRGPVVEGLLSRLLASGRIASLCGLSAVVENGKDLADWLGIDFLEGTPEDRPVVLELRHRLVQDLDKGLKGELRPCFDPCLDDEQGLVFCSSRRGAEKTARCLSGETSPGF
jgi:helicase